VWALLALFLIWSRPAIGQSTGGAAQPLDVTLTTPLLQELPTSDNPFTVLETLSPGVTSDRFTSGGLNVASPPRLEGFLNSWTQTQFRIGDVSITDPLIGGL
jgi:hypothetical protein